MGCVFNKIARQNRPMDRSLIRSFNSNRFIRFYVENIKYGSSWMWMWAMTVEMLMRGDSFYYCPLLLSTSDISDIIFGCFVDCSTDMHGATEHCWHPLLREIRNVRRTHTPRLSYYADICFAFHLLSNQHPCYETITITVKYLNIIQMFLFRGTWVTCVGQKCCCRISYWCIDKMLCVGVWVFETKKLWKYHNNTECMTCFRVTVAVWSFLNGGFR